MKLKVESIQQLSKNIKRIIFSDDTGTFKPEHESGYVKFEFPDAEGNSKLRSYTIRKVEHNRVTIDFVKHQGGIAGAWADMAKVGDVLAARGPGATKLVDTSLDWFLFIGDMTALPAIAVNLKKLPANARGFAMIEIGDESDIQVLTKPEAVEIKWLINADATESVKTILSALNEQPWQQGTPYVWVAGEFDSARAVRHYLKDKKGITKNRYISSYWKWGETDEGNKRAKKKDGGF